MKRSSPFILLLLVAFAAGSLSCNRSSETSDRRGGDEKKAAVPASVARAIPRRIIDYTELTGRTAAVEAVEVRAQVSGYLEEINFKAGSFVHRGDVLFTLDSRVFKAVLAQRQSEAAAKRADLQRLEAELARQQGLIDKNATSRQQLELALAERDQRAAELDSAVASVERAQIDLDYAAVVAPIDGEISREQITVGNLVSSGTTLLTKIVAVDPVHVFFDVDERALLTFRERLAGQMGADADFQVKFAIGDGDFTHVAKVDFSEPQMNETTGTLEFRAVAANPANDKGVRDLVPGLRLRVLFPTSPEYEAVVIPEEAVVTDQNVKRVYVVKDDNTLESRQITLGALQSDNMRVVSSGLAAGERVVTDNFLKIRADSVIEPIEAPSESLTKIVREDGTTIRRDGTVEYDGLYEWSLTRGTDSDESESEALGGDADGGGA